MTDVAPPQVPATVERFNPYVGPRSLRHGEAIFGRAGEIADLRGLIGSRRIVLLYSPSGAGKTSLIEAGLRPALEDRDFYVAPTIRVGYELDDDDDGNRYCASVATCLHESDGDGDGVQPVPDLSVALSPHRERAGDRRLCLIFDQFEELFTLNPADVDAKHEFTRELGRLLDARDVWAMFAIREDFIAQLDPYLLDFPTGLRTRYRLELLGPQAAAEAVREPVAAAGVEFGDVAVEALVDDLRRIQVDHPGGTTTEKGPYVEPLQLQVVCHRLWTPEATVIRADDVARGGGVDRALADYYDDAVEQVVATTRVDEGKLRAWVASELITDDGYRRQTRRGPGKQGDEVLRQLDHAYLIRPERRRGTNWYELSHDRFVGPIMESNRRFSNARTRRRMQRALLIGIAVLVAALVAGAILGAAVTGDDESASLASHRLAVGDPEEIELAPGESRRFLLEGADGGVTVTLNPVGGGLGSATLRLTSVVDDQAGRNLSTGRLDPATSAPGPDRQAEAAAGAASPGTAATSVSVASPGGWPPAMFLVDVQSETGGTFELVARAGSDEPELEVLDENPVRAEITPDTPLQSYRLDAPADADAVRIVVTPVDPSGGFDPELRLIAPRPHDAELVERGLADASTAGFEESLVISEPDASGLVQISGVDQSIGAFTVAVDFPTVTPIEDGVLDGSLNVVGEQRWYAVDFEDQDVVRLEVSAPDADTAVELRRPRGTALASADSALSGGVETLVAEIPGSGIYLVGVTTGFDGTTGEFSLSVDDPDPERLEVPQDAVVAAVGEGEGPAVFEFDGVIDQPVEIAVAPTGDSDLRPDIAVHGPDGLVWRSVPDGRESASVFMLPPFSDRYFADVSGRDGTTGEFEISATSPDSSVLTPGVAVDGVVSDATEPDLFVFEALADRPVEVVVDPDEELDAVVDVQGLGVSRWYMDIPGAGGRETAVVLPPITARYLVEVSGFEGGTGGYTVTLQDVREQVQLDLDGAVPHDITESFGIAVFDVSAPAHEGVAVEVIPDDDLDPALEIVTRWGNAFVNGGGTGAVERFDFGEVGSSLRGLRVLAVVRAIDDGTGAFEIRVEQD